MSYFLRVFFFFFSFQSSQVPSESNTNSSAYKAEEKVGDMKYSGHSLDEVAAMICSTISLYGVKVIMLAWPFLFPLKKLYNLYIVLLAWKIVFSGFVIGFNLLIEFHAFFSPFKMSECFFVFGILWERIVFLSPSWCSAHGFSKGIAISDLQQDWAACAFFDVGLISCFGPFTCLFVLLWFLNFNLV